MYYGFTYGSTDGKIEREDIICMCMHMQWVEKRGNSTVSVSLGDIYNL